MRVTKYIKDYIEKEISDKYDPLIEKIEKENKKSHELLQQELDALKDETLKKADKLAEKYGFTRPNDNWSKPVQITEHYYCNEETEKEIKEKKSQLRNEKHKKISEIILKLEMGEASLKQLHSLLDEVHVEE